MHQVVVIRSSLRYPILLGALLTSIAVAFAAPELSDEKLRDLCHRLHFDQFYPPEAAVAIQQRLQGAPDLMAALTELSGSPTNEVRMLTALFLGDLGDARGAKLLWKLLRDENDTVRISAVGALSRLRRYTSIAPQTDGLTDAHPEVRRLAAAMLAKLTDKSVEPALIDSLSDTNEMVRMEAVRALASCGTIKAVPAIIERLKDPSVLVRTRAAWTLGEIPDAASIEPLRTTAEQDPDWHVRAAAVRSFSHIADVKTANRNEAIIQRLKTDDFALVRDRAGDALTSTEDAQAVLALVQSILSEDRDGRYHAARALIVSKCASALPLLMLHTNNTNPEVREKIIEIFGEIGGTNEVTAVVNALDDHDANVQVAAVTAVQHMRSRVKPDVVIAKLNDPNSHVRAAAARVLGDFGDRAVTPKLIPLLRDENSFVRSAVAEALGKLGDRSAIRPLIDLIAGKKAGGDTDASGDEGLVIGSNKGFLADLKGDVVKQRREAIKALGNLGANEAVDPIIKFGLKAPDPDTRAVSAFSLGQIKDVRAVEPLEDAVRPFYKAAGANLDLSNVIDTGGKAAVDDELRRKRETETKVRGNVIWALGQIADPAAIDVLQKAQSDDNSFVRDAAKEALARIYERQERDKQRDQKEQKPASRQDAASTDAAKT